MLLNYYLAISDFLHESNKQMLCDMSFTKIRTHVITKHNLICVIHIGRRAFKSRNARNYSGANVHFFESFAPERQVCLSSLI